VVAALALLAFAAVGPTHKADAAGLQPSCTFATPIATLVQQGGGADTVTCTFTIRGNAHTLVVDFTVTLGAHPPVKVDACTLDSRVIHIGPCP
jgi:hypothetical protein